MNRRREEILRSEIEDHLSREIEDHVARGMSFDDARAAALRKFGPVLRASEDTRAVWTWTWLERIAQDLAQPMFDVHTMEQFYWARAVGLANIITMLIASMGLTGLALAMIGLYGLVSYAVARRTREIGIRMAIGAARAAVLRMVLRQGLLRAGYGLAIGCALSIVVGRVLPSLFPTTHGIDLWTYVLVPPALLAITAIAVLLPARRASRVDPITALRHE